MLGPSRLFFSTYLESIWITNYLAAALLLRESGALPDDVAGGVGVVAEEAANLIGDFDEGLSNRQTWHNAALAAIAVWFEDEELATRAVQGSTGMLAHLLQGFGDDGMWYEGENYHLFALRGQLTAMGWARQAGVDLLEDERLAARLAAALRAPALTALPDHTFPARKDSRFGVSLAQPMYLELWEVGLARLGDAGSDLWSWLRELYALAGAAGADLRFLPARGRRAGSGPDALAPRSLVVGAAGDGAVAARRRPRRGHRARCCWRSRGWPSCASGRRYASLECGRFGGGHGHPDRLHLTLHRRRAALARRPGYRIVRDAGTSSGTARPSRTTRPGSTVARSRRVTPGARRSTCSRAQPAGAGPAVATAI